MIYPCPKSIVKGNGKFVFSNTITVKINNDEFNGAFDFLSYLIKSMVGIECILTDDLADIEFMSADVSSEEYRLNIANNGVLIEFSDLKGALYAVSSLVQMIKFDDGIYIPSAVIIDSAFAEIRGVHFYMPQRAKINEFKRIIDSMALLKMNTVILEVGGAMEYECHPEINEAWVRFCATINKFPGFNGYKSFQGSDFYWKDSVHTEQSGGSFLTKNEVKDIVKYCKSRGMNVIPEVQGLSHCYYLTIAHPEIAELEDDPFPDTYCPSNEKSYELYFDVATEVIEVFEPTTVSIGHDEIRVLGWCEKCKTKSGHELVGQEILKLYDFYKSKGIRIAMWGESVQTFVNYKGAEVGTKDIECYDRYGRYYQLPSSYKALDLLPDDILMLDWQHSLGHDSEECYNKRGFEVIYGNFAGSLIGEWEKRSSKKCFKGAEVSSWCPATEEIFARDGIFFEMAFSAEILWNDGYCNEKYTDLCEKITAFMPYLRAVMRGESSSFDFRKYNTVYLCNKEKSCQEIKIHDTGYGLPSRLFGVSIDTGNILIKKEFSAKKLVFLHNTKKELTFLPSHYFTDEANWALGAYAVVYEDKTVVLVGLYYGRQIGVKDFRFTRHRDTTTVSFEIDNELEVGESSTVPCYFTKDFYWTESLAYNTTPIITEDGTVFAYEWKNPFPDKQIIKIKPYHIPKKFNEHDLQQSIVLFGILSL